MLSGNSSERWRTLLLLNVIERMKNDTFFRQLLHTHKNIYILRTDRSNLPLMEQLSEKKTLTLLRTATFKIQCQKFPNEERAGTSAASCQNNSKGKLQFLHPMCTCLIHVHRSGFLLRHFFENLLQTIKTNSSNVKQAFLRLGIPPFSHIT